MAGKAAKDKRKTGKDKASPLKQSFKKSQTPASSQSSASSSNKRAAPAPAEPTRAQHSGFLSYMRFASQDSKDVELHNQAAIIQREYSKMSSSQKKEVIMEFFQKWGKATRTLSIVQTSGGDDSKFHGWRVARICHNLHGDGSAQGSSVLKEHFPANPPKTSCLGNHSHC